MNSHLVFQPASGHHGTAENLWETPGFRTSGSKIRTQIKVIFSLLKMNDSI